MFNIKNLNDSRFSWAAALSMASASRISYESPPVIDNVLTKSWGYESTTFLHHRETQCFVANSYSHSILVFRGTNALGDWLSNIDCRFTEEAYGTVHQGFLDAFHAVRSIVLDALVPDTPVVVAGHSLGGALATIAAAEFAKERHIQAVYTYGQPRVGDEHLLDSISKHYSEKFFRFVNDDDIVTRIPPGFVHVGTLIHFDADGSLRGPLTESLASSTEPEPLSKSAFAQMQKDIRQIKHAIQLREKKFGTSKEFDPTEVLNVSAEGLFPGFRDHNIDRYIANIRRQLRQIRFSSNLLALEFGASPETDSSLPLKDRARDKVPVLLRLKAQNWKAPNTLKINSQFGTFATAHVSRSALEHLERDPLVASIEIGRDGGVKELDSSLPFVKGAVLHRPPIEERGGQSLIGLIDTGVDILHEAFLDAVNSSRVIAVWDQRDKSGPSPHSLDPGAFSQDYGTLYGPAEIAHFVANPGATPEPLRDPEGHGTHVASIAAGRGIGAQLGDGLAPDARLVVVIPDSITSPGNPPSIGYQVSHIDALHFLKTVSKGANVICRDAQPMAVNVSLGMNAGAHDGQSPLEAAFDAISSNGRDPGFVIVKSAGNERGHGGHARVRAIPGGTIDISWNSSTTFRFQDYIEVWFQALDELSFVLIDPAQNRSPPVDVQTPLSKVTLGGNVCQLELVTLHPDNGDNLLALTILPQTSPIQSGKWILRISGVNVNSTTGLVDAWVERDGSRAVQFDPDDPYVTLSIPGTADTVIAVGASDSSIPFSLTASSSFGLTRDMRAKPDITAPGTAIVAALANTQDHQASIAHSGTSMAAPHVTGALALVLSGRKKSGLQQLNAQQLRKALIKHAQQRAGFHNEGSGWGILDAEELFKRLVPQD